MLRAQRLLVIGAMLVGLALRLWRYPSFFFDSDTAVLPLFVRGILCGDHSFFDSVVLLSKNMLSGVQPLMAAGFALGASGLGLPASELVWILPALILGTVLIGLAYLLLRELGFPGLGVWAAWLLAVSPPHVMFSRHNGAPWMFEAVVDLLTVLFALRLARDGRSANRAGWAICFAIAAWVGNLALALWGILPALFALRLWFMAPRPRLTTYLRQRFLSVWTLLPLISWSWIFYWAVIRVGHLGHAFHDKTQRWGWYLDSAWSATTADFGPAAAVALAALALLALVRIRSRPLPTLVLAAIFGAYYVPFVLFIPPGTTLVRTYITMGLTGMLLLAALGLAGGGRVLAVLRWSVLSGLCVLLLLGTLNSVQEAVRLPWVGTLRHQGSAPYPHGAQAAAAWIWQRGKPGQTVFTDAYDNTLLKPWLVQYYFQMPTLGMFGALQPEVPYERFKDDAERIDYLLVLPENQHLVPRTFGERFVPRLQVKDGDRTLVFVYARQRGTLEVMDAAAGRLQYARRYTTLCGGLSGGRYTPFR
jgi:hypothetical protein